MLAGPAIVLREGPGMASSGAWVKDGEVGAEGVADIIDWNAEPEVSVMRTETDRHG